MGHNHRTPGIKDQGQRSRSSFMLERQRGWSNFDPQSRVVSSYCLQLVTGCLKLNIL